MTRIQQNQPVVQSREITSDQQVQNIAKIERIDDEEPSSQDSNLMSRKASTFIWPSHTSPESEIEILKTQKLWSFKRFHTELIDEYNEEVDKYRRKRLRHANQEVFKKPYPCGICFTRFHSQGFYFKHMYLIRYHPNNGRIKWSWWLFECKQSVKTSQNGHQHNPSPTSITMISNSVRNSQIEVFYWSLLCSSHFIF